MDIRKLDKNFDFKTEIQRENIKFYDAEENPIAIYGIMKEGDAFCRMPQSIADTVSEGVASLNNCTTGGRVRFITNSPYVAISVFESDAWNTSGWANMTYACTMGYDMYADEGDGQKWIGTFMPPAVVEGKYESVLDFPKKDKRERLVTINLPIFSRITKIYIGIDGDCFIKEPSAYKNETPVAFYGSSITHGVAASRPGNIYPLIISRTLDTNILNLGFSGNAKGEPEIAEYIAGLNMSAFVYDYDYNAPNVEHLEATHEAMFKIIRKANPELPIIMLSRPKAHLTDLEIKRMEVIRQTYDNARAAGDENVYFIAGTDLLTKDVWETALVDSAHPNDSGFLSMAKTVAALLEEIL